MASMQQNVAIRKLVFYYLKILLSEYICLSIFDNNNRGSIVIYGILLYITIYNYNVILNTINVFLILFYIYNLIIN